MNAGACASAVLRSLLALVFACGATLAKALEPPPTGCASADALPWQAVVPGVWVWLPERNAEIAPANGGHVAPTTVIVDGADALVIDPGPSHAHGWRVRQSLACRFKAQVRWVVNSHAHAENVLGNSAFADRVVAGSLEILASAATREAMRLRCPACLQSLTERVGIAAMAGTHTVLPGRTLVAGDVLRLGRHSLQVMPVERGHTEGDLVLWDSAQRVLWAGGLVYGEQVPELAQGHLDDWLEALQRLDDLRPLVLVSSTLWRAEQGGPPPAIAATRNYLQALRSGVLQAMDAGRQPHEAQAVELPAYRQSFGYGQRHGFNVQRAWHQLEPVWMDQWPGPAPSSVQEVGR